MARGRGRGADAGSLSKKRSDVMLGPAAGYGVLGVSGPDMRSDDADGVSGPYSKTQPLRAKTNQGNRRNINIDNKKSQPLMQGKFRAGQSTGGSPPSAHSRRGNNKFKAGTTSSQFNLQSTGGMKSR